MDYEIANRNRISLIYFIAGTLWIVLSDKVISVITNNKDTITYLSMIKGWAYVIITSAIIYFLLNHYHKKTKMLEKDQVCSALKLSLLDKELELVKQRYNSVLNEKIINDQNYLSLQQRFEKSEEEYHLLVNATNDIFWEETDGKLQVSDRWIEITGYGREELDKIKHWEDLLHTSDQIHVLTLMNEHVENNTPYFECEFRIKIKNGKYKWFKAKGKCFQNEQGIIYRMIGVFTDITELKEYEWKLYNIASLDQLTGLQNRAALNEALLNRIIENNQNFALLHLDIDNFKYVNDTMGHTIGDELLVKVSGRLKSIFNNEAGIYRIGADEFIIITPQFTVKKDIERTVIEVIRAFKAPFEVNGSSMYITVSIGVSLYPEHGRDADDLLKNADIAVHKAKETGKNRIVFYNEPMNEKIAERMLIERCLRAALSKNEFSLYYQPQLDLETNRVTGFEALIRWNNEELGSVPPSKFISIAEETRQIIPIGAWVFRSACEFLHRLHQSGYKNLNISINISMLQLVQDDFVDMVVDTIDDIGINPRQVELEITESILMESYETIAGKLRLLRSRGIKVALDDFGKGYSSLNYLKQLPITTLKIDKTFIDTISGNGKNKTLTDQIVNLGRTMELSVVAEGVETKEQLDYLAEHRCHRIQGYYFSKPLPEEEVLIRINEQWAI